MDRIKKGIILLFYFILPHTGSCRTDPCKPVRCNQQDGPVIRFPFRLRDQPHRCSYPAPGFELSCKGNQTLIQLPSFSGQLLVESISYTQQLLYISYPNECIQSLFFKLNLSATPFYYYCGFDTGNFDSSYSPFYEYYTNRRNYIFFNCSSLNAYPACHKEISCLSNFDNHVFIVPSDMDLGALSSSCKKIKNLEGSFVCSPYSQPYYPFALGCEDLSVFQKGQTVSMAWDVPGCNGCEWEGGDCRFKNKTSNETECFDPRQRPPSPPYFIPEYVVPVPHPGARTKYVIIGVSISFFLLVVASLTTIMVYCSWKSKRKNAIENQVKVEKFLAKYKSFKPTRYSYAEIKNMTDQFKTKLGQGGYGSVFKGKLPNGIYVAVKILKMCSGDGEEFANEVGTIGRIHHVNVVRLLGFCADGFKHALIYEFMPNGSLEKFIFPKKSENLLLGWEKLQDIAIGIARGIEYLHQGCDQRILHFDIKPHNILLDHNFTPKLSDFGLAKLCSKEESIVSMTAARGTIGYIAPEVLSRNIGNVSYKSDVYSFGMLLLEMVGGRKNTDVRVQNSSKVFFPEWIYNRLHEGEELGLRIAADGDAKITKQLSIVALWCIQWFPVDRPSMRSVVQMLEGSMESLTMPPNPFVSTTPATTMPETFHSIELTVISQ
ncbi:rust resistance kinase Lr10-like [Tasmannia lanceolata]|uniref:rust resistance kinase Lr10-like n=1 Tax=Tasmannia lanceolata TaxID=3420 RepID=UPI0040647B13